MEPKNESLTQEDWFYTEEWTKDIDKKFIVQLCLHAWVLCRPFTFAYRENLIQIQEKINTTFHKDFGFDYIEDRLALAYNRYTTWKFIINYDGVKYNDRNNSVQAIKSVWKELCEEIEMVQVYINEDEPMWFHLYEIFDPDAERELLLEPPASWTVDLEELLRDIGLPQQSKVSTSTSRASRGVDRLSGSEFPGVLVPKPSEKFGVGAKAHSRNTHNSSKGSCSSGTQKSFEF